MTIKENWAYWAEVNGILHDRYEEWLNNSHRVYHCVFCGDHGPLDHFKHTLPKIEHDVVYCEGCESYKGIEPCIEDYCECWQLDLLRKMKEQEDQNVP